MTSISRPYKNRLLISVGVSVLIGYGGIAWIYVREAIPQAEADPIVPGLGKLAFSPSIRASGVAEDSITRP